MINEKLHFWCTANGPILKIYVPWPLDPWNQLIVTEITDQIILENLLLLVVDDSKKFSSFQEFSGLHFSII